MGPTHPAAPDRVYEAAGGGVAFSADAGTTWRPVDEWMNRHYTWGLAIDAVDPDLWYVSASFGARTAHRNNGDCCTLEFSLYFSPGTDQASGACRVS